MVYLSNAFSLQMQGEYVSQAKAISLSEAKRLLVDVQKNKRTDDDEGEHSGETRVFLRAKSVVGHTDIAALLARRLGCSIPVNRVSVFLEPSDTLVVGQYVGPRLPEGCSVLPDGAKIKWYVVTVHTTPREMELEDMRQHAAEVSSAARKQKCALVGANIEEIQNFLAAEEAAYCGYPDEEGRKKLSEKLGLSESQLQALLS